MSTAGGLDLTAGWPDDAADVAAIEENLQCPICGELFTAPVVISRCGHVFCSLCVRRAMHGTESCPTCRLPSNPSDLRPDRRLERVVHHFARARPLLLQLFSARAASAGPARRAPASAPPSMPADPLGPARPAAGPEEPPPAADEPRPTPRRGTRKRSRDPGDAQSQTTSQDSAPPDAAESVPRRSRRSERLGGGATAGSESHAASAGATMTGGDDQDGSGSDFMDAPAPRTTRSGRGRARASHAAVAVKTEPAHDSAAPAAAAAQATVPGSEQGKHALESRA